MAAKKDITIRQGANFKMVIDYRNADGTAIPLTGYTFSFYIKDRPGGATILNGSAYVQRDTATTGRAIVNVPHTVTSGLNFDQGVYDILLIAPDASRSRAVEGRAFFSRAVST